MIILIRSSSRDLPVRSEEGILETVFNSASMRNHDASITRSTLTPFPSGTYMRMNTIDKNLKAVVD